MIPTLYKITPAVNLRAIQTDRFKNAQLSVSLILPADKELSPLTTLLFSVLRRGTEQYPTIKELNLVLDMLYGASISYRNTFFGDSQVIGFVLETLGKRYLPDGEQTDPLKVGIGVIEQMLFHPLLDENGLLRADAVQSEIENTCDDIRAQINDTRSYARMRLRECMFQGQPYGASLVGKVEQVQGFTPLMLTEHWKRILQSARIECFYVGSDDPAYVASLLKNVFLDAPASLLPMQDTTIPSPRTQVQYVNEDLAVAQGKLEIGFYTGITPDHPDAVAQSVFNELFGGSSVSRLFLNLREKKSLCYHCYSSAVAHKGIMTVSCGIHPDNREIAEREIFAELTRLQQKAVGKAELKMAQRSLINALRQCSDSPAALQSYWFGRQVFYSSTLTPEKCIERVKAVTAQDVMRVSRAVVPDMVYFLNGTLGGEEDDDES
ncbi:MAG: insulinase family protein [Clostridia bacterium]|nr:insulinase family protein [Clostridia bacterium]